MKIEERKEARKLRKDSGLSIRDISKRLKVSRSSVSLWIRDIILTDDQIKVLRDNNPILNGQMAGTIKNKQIWMKKRKEFQKIGRMMAKENSSLHLMGCMLYWAEGHRKNNRSVVSFVNSDLAMIKLFIRFLKECFGLSIKDIKISINCHTDAHTVEEIETKWLEELSFPRECLNKTTVNNTSSASKQKRTGLLKYGTCRVCVCSVEIMQKIYGSIQEYGNFTRDEWVK